MTRLLSVALMLLLFITCPAQESVPAKFRSAIEQIDSSTAAALKNNPGSVTIGLVANANLIWAKSYGYADLEQKVPTTQEVAGYGAMAFFERHSKTGVIILHNATGDQFDGSTLLVQALNTLAASQGAAN